ncbi:unnamed protein product [Paramecium pentaurelia]|uniref:Uncharacterized protein n=1 Tax=Paramecium pentaurelia TaxID=43138 RepID=A0A8S1STW5_9CILI|nr:unnamed protein product [Paramecium pentaurelia]
MSILRRISENRRISDISRASTVINFYQPFTDRKLQRILILEYLGTTLFGIGLQSAKDDFQIQLVIFFSMLFSARHSGAHYHIAVTLILMFRPHYPINRFRGVLQIIVGILGFMTGAYFGYHMLNSLLLINRSNLQSKTIKS